MSRVPANSHRCRWPGCAERIGRQHWACIAHWNLLPLDIREALGRHTNGKGSPGGKDRAHRNALTWINVHHPKAGRGQAPQDQ